MALSSAYFGFRHLLVAIDDRLCRNRIAHLYYLVEPKVFMTIKWDFEVAIITLIVILIVLIVLFFLT